MTTMLDMADPQAGLPEFLRRRQPNYAQAPQGLLSQQAYQAAGPFPQYEPKPMTINPALAPAPEQGGQSGSDGGGGAAGLGGILGALAQNPQGVSSLANQLRGLGGNGVEGLANLGSLSSLSSAAGIGGLGQPGLMSLGSLGGLSSTGLGATAAGGLETASLSGLLGGSGSVASQAGGMGAALNAGAGGSAAAGGASAAPAASGAAAGGIPWGTVAGGAAALGGGLLAYDGIKDGREGQAALGGAIAGAGVGSLAGLSGLAALGPAGLVGAGVAALASSLVNTKEFGDVALRNYWNGVDQGRNIGESDPTELAQGFVNFYRTNKNEFAPQAVYGRTGNEDFLYDMQRHINGSIETGRIGADATPGQIYESIVKPWMQTMGEGPKDEKAAAIQDFMMTDLINSYQQGKPISNAQVKGDKKFRIVSEGLRYPSAMQPTAGADTMGLLGAM